MSDVSTEVGAGEVRAGEVLGLVGGSGLGKGVTLKDLMRLLPPGARVEGRALWQGRDLVAMPEPELRGVRGGEASMIFQEPMTALNPVLPVGLQIEKACGPTRPWAGAPAGRANSWTWWASPTRAAS